MKFILSRKGFDSGYGGIASPIFPDGTMLSFPIPTDIYTGRKLSELCYTIPTTSRRLSYLELIHELDEKEQYEKATTRLIKEGKMTENIHEGWCHLDPDIRLGEWSDPVSWKPAFGQTDKAQSHLMGTRHNQKSKNPNPINPGDVFLFLGRFQKIITDIYTGKYRYNPYEPVLHVIYGYLQIGENGMLIDDDITKWSPTHPHAITEHYVGKSNMLYTPSEKLRIDGVNVGKKSGSGTLNFREDRVLTAPGHVNISKWKLHDWMRDTFISYHGRGNHCNTSEGFFQNVAKGQEFVVEENPKVTEWAKNLLSDDQV
jgi:hypothetical protein